MNGSGKIKVDDLPMVLMRRCVYIRDIEEYSEGSLPSQTTGSDADDQTTTERLASDDSESRTIERHWPQWKVSMSFFDLAKT